MIKSFKHKGLRLLWEEGKTNRLPVELVSRMLEIIDSATEVPDDFGAFPN